jgi:CheY-like chemotaxis protein/DNA-directed RNA polymerase subunit RPC12/RpoP
VRTAEDGFSALAEMRKEIPDILLSDLNMQGMSGFELLSVVRHRFPAIQVIAMSAAFPGDAVPTGVAADAFYEKGKNPSSLLQMVKVMTQTARSSPHHQSALMPIWIQKNGHDPSGAEYVIITCPDCLRTFPQTVGDAIQLIRETACTHCSNLIHYAIVPPSPPRTFQPKQAASIPASHRAPDICS